MQLKENKPRLSVCFAVPLRMAAANNRQPSSADCFAFLYSFLFFLHIHCYNFMNIFMLYVAFCPLGLLHAVIFAHGDVRGTF